MAIVEPGHTLPNLVNLAAGVDPTLADSGASQDDVAAALAAGLETLETIPRTDFAEKE